MMHGEYRPQQGTLGPSNQAIIRLGLEWLSRARVDPGAAKAWRHALNDFLAEPRADLDPKEAARQAAGPAPDPRLPPEGESQLTLAVELAHASKWDEAAGVLNALSETAPDEPRVQSMRCMVNFARHIPARELIGQCARAAELDPKEPGLPLDVAVLASDLGDEARARRSLADARARLDARGTASAPAWANMAIAYSRLRFVTYAEQAAERAGPTPTSAEVSEWAAATRHWMGLPPDAGQLGISPDLEPDYLAEMDRAVAAESARKWREASAGVRTLLQRFPGAPGPLSLICRLEQRAGNAGAAKKACGEALAAYEGTLPAHLAMAQLLAASHAWKEAAGHLERAVELDPAREASWKNLAELYRRSGDAAKVDEVRKRFTERFSRPMP
jgi:predicted Zn-dependent protease